MFNYHQNAELSYIGQQDQLAKAENERLASQTEQTPSFYGAVLSYLSHKLSLLGHRAAENQQVEPAQTSTPEPATSY
jgi:hypothetical protein